MDSTGNETCTSIALQDTPGERNDHEPEVKIKYNKYTQEVFTPHTY